MAPKLLGSGTAAVADLGIETITAALDLKVTDVTVLDDNVRITAVPRRKV